LYDALLKISKPTLIQLATNLVFDFRLESKTQNPIYQTNKNKNYRLNQNNFINDFN